MKINLNYITPFEKLTIQKGLCDYEYIMNHWQENDDDFQRVYYNFYLSARWVKMGKKNIKDFYFSKLQSISADDDLISIIDDFAKNSTDECLEFSIISKMLHTRNNNSPIYDSKIRNYLSECENQQFYWQRKGAPRGMTQHEKIEHDWTLLKKWYSDFLESDRGKQWIEWFDVTFPAYSHISSVKKVDFIIFAKTNI